MVSYELAAGAWRQLADAWMPPPSINAQRHAMLVRVRACARRLSLVLLQPRWQGSRVGYASRTEYPEWAMQCLRGIEVGGGVRMADVAKPLFEIYPGCKTAHFAKFHKATGIAYR